MPTGIYDHSNNPACFKKGQQPRLDHGFSTRVFTHPLYYVWQAMKQRCNNPKNKNWKDYGGRGIKVCSRWQKSFIAFLKDMSDCPKGMSLDRINNNGNYEPSNCRWTTQLEQVHNRRT